MNYIQANEGKERITGLTAGWKLMSAGFQKEDFWIVTAQSLSFPPILETYRIGDEERMILAWKQEIFTGQKLIHKL